MAAGSAVDKQRLTWRNQVPALEHKVENQTDGYLELACSDSTMCRRAEAAELAVLWSASSHCLGAAFAYSVSLPPPSLHLIYDEFESDKIHNASAL
jgi:hypothetical protein